MNPGRFFMNGIRPNFNSIRGINYLPSRGNIGLFGRLTNSFKSFNWSNLLNGANKTLNVVNQTIPLVRQAGPMFNNMKSMLRLAKVFGKETGSTNFNYSKSQKNDYSNINGNNLNIIENKEKINHEINYTSDNDIPVFFI